MKISQFFFLCLLSLTAACNAQKTLECLAAQRGNTGHRGIVPAEDRDKPRPQGKDYFTLELKSIKTCTLEIVQLIVKDYGGQVVLKPVFENNTSKTSLKAGETCYIRVEKEQDVTVAKPNIKNEGSLIVKINGKQQIMAIEKFQLILPQ
jgi:hypothetical protein